VPTWRPHPPTRAATVYTVHNLAYQGLFPHADFRLLDLPARFMSHTGLEFHGQLSFMKAGLKYAKRVTTVSPTYAREIATHEFGVGLDGVIRGRGNEVSGVLNGVDGQVWNPADDNALSSHYSAAQMAGKAQCKQALQRELGLAEKTRSAGVRRGQPVDVTEGPGPRARRAAGHRAARRAQLALQGSGEPGLEAAFREAAKAQPQQVGVRIGYDEAFAHRLIAGSDAILVPSRFEPCGLTQMYGLRYGTLPIVRRVGGLSDTVVDANADNLRADRATGFVFDAASVPALDGALQRAGEVFHERPRHVGEAAAPRHGAGFLVARRGKSVSRAVPEHRGQLSISAPRWRPTATA